MKKLSEKRKDLLYVNKIKKINASKKSDVDPHANQANENFNIYATKKKKLSESSQ